jgi:peptidoglycan hydrolase-like protein with peptidoglycan-binding domain
MSGSLSPWPVVATGHNGHPVKTLQFLLRARGHTVTVDGVFGPQTDAAVKAFQTSKGLAANGTVDPNTWTALIIQVKRAAAVTQYAVCRRNSSSATSLATRTRGSRSTASLDRKPIARYGDFNTPCRSMSLRWQ